VDDTIDVIRKRFGNDAVKRAVFVNQPIDHMSGGISREKRSVDYSKIVVD
jgi:DNA polymerase IV 2